MDKQFQRVIRLKYRDRTVWRKQYGLQGRRLRMSLLRWFASLLGANALIAPTPVSPEEACAIEKDMIQRLRQLDVLVPEIIETGDDYLVVSDIGTLFSQKCRETKALEKRLDLLKKGFDALNDLHARGGYLSQAFARNMTLLNGNIGFIDLDEDPLKVMTLEAAQARDILFFVHSTARFMRDAPEKYEAMLQLSLKDVPDKIKHEIAKVSRILKFFIPLTYVLPERARMAAMAWRQLAKV